MLTVGVESVDKLIRHVSCAICHGCEVMAENPCRQAMCAYVSACTEVHFGASPSFPYLI